jgi:plastocyanin
MSIRSLYSFACAAFAAAVAAAGLAGCFSDHTVVEPPTGAQLCSGTQPPNVVRIVDFGFSPSTLTVAKGTKVTFVNCGTNQHTTTQNAGAWGSPLLSPHETYDVTPAQAGSYGYHCTPHPFMQGTVVVQ